MPAINWLINMKAAINKWRSRLRVYRKNVWLLDGNEKHGGLPLKVLYIGRELNKNYVAHLAYGDEHREDHQGKIWVWTIPRLTARHRDVDLVIYEDDGGELKPFERRSDFNVPCWVNSEIDLPLDESRIKGKESLRSDIRNIRKHGYEYEITRDEQKYRLFYDTMYVPYIIAAHGDRAALMSLDEMIKSIASTDLLLIRRGPEYLAGEVLIYAHGGVRAWSLGVKDGDYRYVREGALGALYYFKMQYLAGQGFTRLNAGASRAFLEDGVLQYKMKWGARLTSPRQGSLLLQIVTRSPALISFLKNNPFIDRKGGALNGVVCWPEECEFPGDRKASISKRLSLPGLKKLGIYYLKESAETGSVARTENLEMPAPDGHNRTAS